MAKKQTLPMHQFNNKELSEVLRVILKVLCPKEMGELWYVVEGA